MNSTTEIPLRMAVLNQGLIDSTRRGDATSIDDEM